MAHKKGSKCGCKHGGKKRGWVSYVHVVKQLPKESLKYTHPYANAYGVKVCKGQVKAGGKKKTAPGYSKAKRR